MMPGSTHRLALWLGVTLAALLFCGAPGQAFAAKDRFVVDLASEPSTLDPPQQWNQDSYYVYRNIFDNLITRDDRGRLCRRWPQPEPIARTARSTSACATTSPSTMAAG